MPCCDACSDLKCTKVLDYYAPPSQDSKVLNEALGMTEGLELVHTVRYAGHLDHRGVPVPRFEQWERLDHQFDLIEDYVPIVPASEQDFDLHIESRIHRQLELIEDYVPILPAAAGVALHGETSNYLSPISELDAVTAWLLVGRVDPQSTLIVRESSSEDGSSDGAQDVSAREQNAGDELLCGAGVIGAEAISAGHDNGQGAQPVAPSPLDFDLWMNYLENQLAKAVEEHRRGNVPMSAA